MFRLEYNEKFLTEQMQYADKISNILKERISEPKACVITYGCQQNVSDSQRLMGLLNIMGYDITEQPEEADFILFNTCAVRGHAEDRVWGNVGSVKKYKSANPNLMVAVCGCMAQQQQVAERFKKSYPYVDIVFGTQLHHRLPEFIYKRLSGGKRIFELGLENGDIVENFPVMRDDRVKGYLPIMYGCNNFCTYCIVPYVRGRERSRNPQEIIAEAKRMINAGYKEIMLLGQNVNSYGFSGGINFACLLRMINDIEGDFRIRFMTSHPKDCTEELLDAMRDCEKVERHLHLPFQCGSDRVLKLMNRRYDTERYLYLVQEARKRMPDIQFTSDIIVGFPGETYEDFLGTLEIVKKVRFTSLFTFIYSPREGTPAATMPDPVSREEKGRWFDELLACQDKIGREISESLVGQTLDVLCEGQNDKSGKYFGKCEGYSEIEFNGSQELVGKFVKVKVDSFKNVLCGTVIE